MLLEILLATIVIIGTYYFSNMYRKKKTLDESAPMRQPPPVKTI